MDFIKTHLTNQLFMTYVINSCNLCIWRIFNKIQWEGICVFTSLPILYVFRFISNMKKAPFVQTGKEMKLTVWQHNVTFQLHYHSILLDNVLNHFFLPRFLHYIVLSSGFCYYSNSFLDVEVDFYDRFTQQNSVCTPPPHRPHAQPILASFISLS
jgi:hypothetical protein